MRLAIQNISQEDRLNLLADIFGDKKPGILNGVDLSTQEGKQKYIEAVIAGKNPFSSEDEMIESLNINTNITTSWSDIVRQADGSSVVPVKTSARLDAPFDNALLNVAYSKKMDEIQMDTALPSDEIADRLLEEYSNSLLAKKSLSAAVKFFHNITSSIFTDCESCGGENHPSWTICGHCGVSRDGSPVKRGKIQTAS